MAKLFNLARVTTATTGTGTITLGSAVSGALSFAAAGVADGDVVRYGIKDGSASEVGTGTYTASGTTLTRTVLKSTNSDAAINLSGSAEVFICDAAEDHLPHDALSIPGAAIVAKRLDGVPTWARAGVMQITQLELRASTSSGTGAAGFATVINANGAVAALATTGTTSTGGTGLRNAAVNDAQAGPMNFVFHPKTVISGTILWPDAISDGTDAYRTTWGFTDAWPFADFGANSIHFRYDLATFGDANIRAVTRASSSSTTTDTGVAVVSGTPVRWAIAYDSTSQVRFYLDDVLVATHTTNIPIASVSGIPIAVEIRKTAGTNNRRVVNSNMLYLREF